MVSGNEGNLSMKYDNCIDEESLSETHRSQGLKDSSMEYAIKLLDTCTTGTPEHDPVSNVDFNVIRWQFQSEVPQQQFDCLTIRLLYTSKTNPFGENLARNKGSGSWGQLYHPDKILNR